MENSTNSMMILIAGTYRSGTNDDPALIKKNVEEMESYALPIRTASHFSSNRAAKGWNTLLKNYNSPQEIPTSRQVA
jgi:hypothetical protein